MNTSPLFDDDQQAHFGGLPSATKSREQALKMGPDARARYVESIVIYSDHFERAIVAVETLMSRQGSLQSPGGLRIVGPGGVGKTFIIKTISARYPRIDHGREIECPVAVVSFRKNPTIGSFTELLMEAVGGPGSASRMKSADRADFVATALESCRCKVLVIDEAHELVPTSGLRRNRDRLAGEVGDYLKSLYDRSAVPIVWAGLGSLDTLFERDSQLSSRWPGRIQLHNYENGELWRLTLEIFDEALPMSEPGGLSAETMSNLLYEATAGNMRILKILLSESVRVAVTQGSTSIKADHVRAARESLCM